MNSMKLENVRVYNLQNAIRGVHYITDWKYSDTESGIDFYDNIWERAEKIANSQNELDVIPVLNNILLYQDDNGLCEYCAIGPNDLELISKLPPWRKATLRKHILVGLDITSTARFWIGNILSEVPVEALQQDNVKVHITTNYAELKKIVDLENSVFMKTDEWKNLIKRIKCLPYAQQLIL